jgi:hypothetical protein
LFFGINHKLAYFALCYKKKQVIKCDGYRGFSSTEDDYFKRNEIEKDGVVVRIEKKATLTERPPGGADKPVSLTNDRTPSLRRRFNLFPSNEADVYPELVVVGLLMR